MGLSRQAVADRLAEFSPGLVTIDQATISKWETGETAVRVEDFELLAKVYGTTADRLFFPPGDAHTPELLKRFHSAVQTKNTADIERLLTAMELMPNR